MGEETWRVVGGSKGGIVVRAGKVLTSPELPEKLSKGALLRQRDLQGERLYFERVAGSGPDSGWVSTKVGGKDIVVKGGCVPLDQVNFGRPIIKSASAAGTEVWLLADHRSDCIQSYAALALGLMKGSYRVRFFGPSSSEVLVRSLGISFTAAGLTIEEFQAMMMASGQADRIWDLGAWVKDSARWKAEVLQAAVKASPKLPDLLLYTTPSAPVALAFFSKHGVPIIMGNVTLPVEGWDPGYHSLIYSTSDDVQEVFGVSPFRGMGFEAFYGLLLNPRQLIGTSAVELETLEGEMHRDLATKLYNCMVGYLYLPAEVQVRIDQTTMYGGGPDTQAALEGFLSKGPAIYLGWGTKVGGELSGELAAVAVGALKLLGMRGIIAAGSDSGPSADAMAAALFPTDKDGLSAYAQANVLFLPGGAPHEWLFPRCACVVHHGGSGTTATALRGTAPMVIMPTEDRNWRFGMFVEKHGLGACVQAGLWDATAEDVAKAIKQALQPSAKQKAKEFSQELSQQFGVRNAVLGMNMIIQGEVKSGKMKEEWKHMKAQEAKEEAFQKELDEEPEDGVLRPPPALLAAGPDASAGTAASSAPSAGKPPARRLGTAPSRAPPPPPPWLRPDGKGKILTLCSPLKGHVVHFKRIVQWFRDRAPGYEVHMVLCVDEPDIPAGVVKHVIDSRPGADKNFAVLTSLFAAAAGLESAEKAEKAFADSFTEKKESDEEGGSLSSMDKLPKVFMEVFMSLRPHVVITEMFMTGLIMEGFIPALCRTYEALLVSIIPMCIKEDMGHSMRRVQKTLERRQNKIYEQAGELYASLESKDESGEEGEWKGEDGAGGEAAEGEPGEQAEAAEKESGPAAEAEKKPEEDKAKEEQEKKEEEAAGDRKQEEGVRPPWMPESMTMDELNHIIWKVIPATQWQPNLSLYPSPAFFHAEKPEGFEVYCTPFLPLPSLSASGAPQHGRAALEGSIGPDLLDWLFSEESDDPIVYVAFGTIVSNFKSRLLVERIVEALSNAPWRVLLVLPEDARAGLPQEGDTNFWRWSAVGAEAAKGVGMEVREGDVFTEEHLVKLRKASAKLRDRPTLAELGIITETTARLESLLPGRWRVESFVPQVHVLRCERVRVFMSHNGANSTLESMACGVPMLCTPFFMDQYDWARTVRENLRAGIQVDKILTGSEALRGAVRELLQEPAYRRNAQAVARRIAAQSELLSKALGPAMMPKASLGPGLSVLGALCVSHIKKQDAWPSLEGPLTAPPPARSVAGG